MKFALIAFVLAAAVQGAPPARWWESSAAIVRLSLKPGRGAETVSLKPDESRATLDRLAAKGIHAVEIFAPAYGGNSFNGLDTIDR